MEKYVVGIGATNVDIYCKSKIEIKDHYDHPSDISYTPGGVTRNILENIHKLGLNTKLLTCVGDDIYGSYLLERIKESGIDNTNIDVIKDGRTGLFVQVQDKNNDMHIAMCDMNIFSHIDVKFIKKKEKIFKGASGIVLDPSLDKEVLDYIFDNFADIPIFVDPISDMYAKKIRPYLSKIYCIKPNQSELGVLANMKIDNHIDLLMAYEKVLKKGVKKVYVSLGKDGCMYNDDDNHIYTRCFRAVEKMVNASGAGDSFFAAIIYSYVTGLSLDDTIDYALGAGIAAIICEETINPKLSVNLIKEIIKERK